MKHDTTQYDLDFARQLYAEDVESFLTRQTLHPTVDQSTHSSYHSSSWEPQHSSQRLNSLSSRIRGRRQRPRQLSRLSSTSPSSSSSLLREVGPRMWSGSECDRSSIPMRGFRVISFESPSESLPVSTWSNGRPRNLLLHLALANRDLTNSDYDLLQQLDDQQGMRSGLTKSQISIYPSSTVDVADKVENCSICLDDMTTGQKTRRLPCLHVFHIQCIDEWLQRSNMCPIDRQKTGVNQPH